MAAVAASVTAGTYPAGSWRRHRSRWRENNWPGTNRRRGDLFQVCHEYTCGKSRGGLVNRVDPAHGLKARHATARSRCRRSSTSRRDPSWDSCARRGRFAVARIARPVLSSEDHAEIAICGTAFDRGASGRRRLRAAGGDRLPGCWSRSRQQHSSRQCSPGDGPRWAALLRVVGPYGPAASAGWVTCPGFP